MIFFRTINKIKAAITAGTIYKKSIFTTIAFPPTKIIEIYALPMGGQGVYTKL